VGVVLNSTLQPFAWPAFCVVKVGREQERGDALARAELAFAL
jgi:hypothetical protein